MRLDSSSLKAVTWVFITRYTRWHMFSTVGRCVVTIHVLFGRCWMMFFNTLRSVATSSADVASSKSRIGASRKMARAMAMRCVCPSENPRPFSPIFWLKVSGSFSTNSQAHAIFKASTISSSVAFSLAMRMFSAMVPDKMVFPCGTYANKWRVSAFIGISCPFDA